MGMIQEAADREGFETLSVVGRRAPFPDRNCVRIGGPASFWMHVAATTLFDRHGFGSYFATKKILDRIRTEDPDIIHLHNLHGYYLYLPLLFRYLKNEYRGKTYWTFHDCWPFTGHCAFYTAAGCDKWKTGCGNCPNKKQYPVSLFLDGSKRNYRDKKRMFTSLKDLTILVPSEWMERQVRESFMGKYPVRVVPNGVDLEVFRPGVDQEDLSGIIKAEAERERKKLCRKYGLDAEKKHIIGAASVWDERKGLGDFEKLAAALQKECEPADKSRGYEILLVGLSPAQIRKLPKGIIGIRRTDDREELAKLYALSDIFINPSLEESFSLVTVEAIACGTPAIVLDTSAVAELVNEENGIVLHEHEPEDYLKAIRQLEGRKLSREQIAKTARRYDAGIYGRKVLDLYADNGIKGNASEAFGLNEPGCNCTENRGKTGAKSRPLFTIITVCYNAEKEIVPTLESVREQTFRDFEYLIKDGGSTDKTLSVTEGYLPLVSGTDREPGNPAVRLISGKDGGIYEAMNIAVKEASGEYILFLNAGDTFADEEVLSRVARTICAVHKEGTGSLEGQKTGADIYYGDVYEIQSSDPAAVSLRTYTKKNAKLSYYSLGACLNHQAMFCRRRLFEKKPFDTDYRVCADREWQMYHIRYGASAVPLGFPVARILTEGFSSSNIPLLEKETDRCVKTYCGGWYVLYRTIGFLKKNPLIRRVIRNSEKHLSIRKSCEKL